MTRGDLRLRNSCNRWHFDTWAGADGLGADEFPQTLAAVGQAAFGKTLRPALLKSDDALLSSSNLGRGGGGGGDGGGGAPLLAAGRLCPRGRANVLDYGADPTGANDSARPCTLEYPFCMKKGY